MKREKKQKKSSKKKMILLIATGVILFIAILTNPKKQDYADKVSSILYDGTVNNVEKDMIPFAMLGISLADNVLDNIILVDNYIFFSIAKGSFLGNTKVIALGLFGQVILFGDAKDAFESENLYN